MSGDHDRDAGAGSYALSAGALGDFAFEPGVVVDARGLALRAYPTEHADALERYPTPDRIKRSFKREGAGYLHAVIGLVAGDGDEWRLDDATDLFGNDGKEFVRLDALRDQRRHTSQRSLLVGQLCQRLTGFGVRDRRGDELSEPFQPRLRVGRKVVDRVDRDRSPTTAVDDDRAGDLRQVAVVSEEVRDLAADGGQVVLDDTGRASGSKDVGWREEVVGRERAPSGTASTLLETPTTRSSGPGSKRTTPATSNVAGSRPKTRSTSELTAPKISAGAMSCATSVATRRSAACSSASRASDSLAFVLVTSGFESEITSSVSAAYPRSLLRLNRGQGRRYRGSSDRAPALRRLVASCTARVRSRICREIWSSSSFC